MPPRRGRPPPSRRSAPSFEVDDDPALSDDGSANEDDEYGGVTYEDELLYSRSPEPQLDERFRNLQRRSPSPLPSGFSPSKFAQKPLRRARSHSISAAAGIGPGGIGTLHKAVSTSHLRRYARAAMQAVRGDETPTHLRRQSQSCFQRICGGRITVFLSLILVFLMLPFFWPSSPFSHSSIHSNIPSSSSSSSSTALSTGDRLPESLCAAFPSLSFPIISTVRPILQNRESLIQRARSYQRQMSETFSSSSLDSSPLSSTARLSTAGSSLPTERELVKLYTETKKPLVFVLVAPESEDAVQHRGNADDLWHFSHFVKRLTALLFPASTSATSVFSSVPRRMELPTSLTSSDQVSARLERLDFSSPPLRRWYSRAFSFISSLFASPSDYLHPALAVSSVVYVAHLERWTRPAAEAFHLWADDGNAPIPSLLFIFTVHVPRNVWNRGRKEEMTKEEAKDMVDRMLSVGEGDDADSAEHAEEEVSDELKKFISDTKSACKKHVQESYAYSDAELTSRKELIHHFLRDKWTADVEDSSGNIAAKIDALLNRILRNVMIVDEMQMLT